MYVNLVHNDIELHMYVVYCIWYRNAYIMYTCILKYEIYDHPGIAVWIF